VVLSPALGARAAGPILAAALLSSGVTYEGIFLILTLAVVLSLALFLGARPKSP